MTRANNANFWNYASGSQGDEMGSGVVLICIGFTLCDILSPGLSKHKAAQPVQIANRDGRLESWKETASRSNSCWQSDVKKGCSCMHVRPLSERIFHVCWKKWQVLFPRNSFHLIELSSSHSFILYYVSLFNAHETFIEPTLIPTNSTKRILGKEMNQHQVTSVSRPQCKWKTN